MSLPKLLHATRWLNLLDVDGWVFASRRRPGDPKSIDAVNIIAWHRHSLSDTQCRLVVLEEFRKPIGQWEFSLPAGLLEKNESIAECGTRELKEETGLDVTTIDYTSGETFSSAGLSDETHAFITLQCQGAPSLKPGVGGEKIRVHLFGQRDCEALLEKNRQGHAAISARLWPILVSLAHAGSFAGAKIAP
jgi:8-oxo-dGTP pyrophosphatase MutT (NUDIX family)